MGFLLGLANGIEAERNRMKTKHGFAVVWFCDPEKDEAGDVPGAEDNAIAPGCGFFGFYKPESDKQMRSCPACGNVDTYVKLADKAKIEVIANDAV